MANNSISIGGKSYKFSETFDSIITVPDCFVMPANKIGTGNGEAKLYMSSKESMRGFFGSEGFVADCFLVKQDLLDYLQTLRNEYIKPTYDYRGKDKFPKLWAERLKLVDSLPDIITFKVADQAQIGGPRGYVNSDDDGYKLIRQLSLPLVTYISVMQVYGTDGKPRYYWKLFVDFETLGDRTPLVFKYGKRDLREPVPVAKNQETEATRETRARVGQQKYREKLLEECPFCPITMVNDDRLLIASHIKPWAVSDDKERVDPKNGFMLSPLYDKLFDQGFITFTDDKKMQVSHWLSPRNCERLSLKDGLYVQRLPLDEKRLVYLEYHQKFVFKG